MMKKYNLLSFMVTVALLTASHVIVNGRKHENKYFQCPMFCDKKKRVLSTAINDEMNNRRIILEDY